MKTPIIDIEEVIKIHDNFVMKKIKEKFKKIGNKKKSIDCIKELKEDFLNSIKYDFDSNKNKTLLDIYRERLELLKPSQQEIINKIDRVSMEDIDRVVEKIFQKSKLNFAYVGKLDKHEKVENQIKQILFNN